MSAPLLVTPQPTDSMAAVRALNRMRRAGFVLRLVGDGLQVAPIGRMTDAQRAFLREHKAALVQLLNDAETVYNALQGAGAAGLAWREGTPAEWADTRLLACNEVLYADGRMVNVWGRRYVVEYRPPVPDIQPDVSTAHPPEPVENSAASMDKPPDSPPTAPSITKPLTCEWSGYPLKLKTKCTAPDLHDLAPGKVACRNCGGATP